MMRHRRNPSSPSALTLAEAGILQDAILLVGGAVIFGVVGYVIWQKIQSAVPSVRTALPLLLPTTPGVDPLPPIDMPGGYVPVPFTSGPDNTLVGADTSTAVA